MSWERVPESDELWQRRSSVEIGEAWLYIHDEDGSYIRATRDSSINSEALGKALLINDSKKLELTFGHATMQGARAQQEDRVWVQDSDFLPYCSASTAHFMVADGHVGDCAAEFAIRRLPTAARHNMQEAIASWVYDLRLGEKTAGDSSTKEVVEIAPAEEPTEVPPLTPPTDQRESTRKRGRSDLQDENESPPSKLRRKKITESNKEESSTQQLYHLLSEAMISSYSEVDSDFLRMNKTSKSGSTCSSITILGSLCVFANIGDSRMILIKHPHARDPRVTMVNSDDAALDGRVAAPDGRGASDGGRACVRVAASVVRMSAEHKPGHDGEKNRITQAGGTVRRIGGCWRVLPDVDTGSRSGVALAVSRSFGDRMLKKYVISEPDVTVLELQPNIDAALVIATDGVWDTIDDQSAGRLVYSYHEARDANQAARALIKAAYQAGSEVRQSS